jgi:hypothetical protein
VILKNKSQKRLRELRRKSAELAAEINKYQAVIDTPGITHDERRRATRSRVELEDRKDKVDEEIDQLESKLKR